MVVEKLVQILKVDQAAKQTAANFCFSNSLLKEEGASWHAGLLWKGMRVRIQVCDCKVIVNLHPLISVPSF